MDTRSLVSIILVNWNGLDVTLECVRSCLALDYPRFHIVIVDNGSAADSVSALRDAFAQEPCVHLIEVGRNLGFAEGNNLGMRYAREADAGFVWLLNNDTEVDPGALSALIEAAEAHPEAGLLGSKIYFFDRPTTIWFAGAGIDPIDGHSYHIGEGEVDCGQFDAVRETEYITGCSILARTEVIDQIGGMSDDFFLYWEEVDWCARAAEAGWKLLYVPGSRVWHKVSSSFSGNRQLQLRYEMRNRLLFHKRHRRDRLGRVMRHGVARVAYYAVRGHFGEVRGIGGGIIDFLRGRFGRIG
ncbi:MAG: glycosyltransferase family 2 protein [Actinomycetota bacterium]|nr:glycosyltransferase family 2 protein [Actinomycetota bacterium]